MSSEETPLVATTADSAVEVVDWWSMDDEQRAAVIVDLREKGRCGAKPKRGSARQWPCLRDGRTGAGGRCYWHGGASTGRPLKHGRSSRYLGAMRKGSPERRAFEESMEDDRLLDTSPTLALYDARITKLLERQAELDSPEFRADALTRFGELEEAIRSGDTALAGTKLVDLGEHLRRGAKESKVWKQLLEAASERSKRAEAAVANMLKGAQAVTQHDLVVVLGKLQDIVIQTCGSERKMLARDILVRFDREAIGTEAVK